MQQAATRQKKTMTVIRLIFICMLPLTANSQNDFNTVATGKLTPDQVTPAMSNFTSIIAAVTTKNNETMKTSATPSLPAHQTTPSKTLQPDIHTATSTYSILSQSSSSTTGSEVTSATMVVSNQTSNPTTPTRVPRMLRGSTQSQEARKTSTSLFISDKTTRSFTSLTQSTNHVSTIISSTKPVSTQTLPVTSGGDTQSTGLYKTSKTTAGTPVKSITKTKKKPDPSQNSADNQNNHGKVVAGLIGGALTLMMAGLLFIYIKKRKLQKQQITTSEWAGPSPFLQDGADNGQVSLRSSNRISFTGFLPQRQSKRLSLLPEGDELEEITAGSTFGGKNQGSSFGREEDGNDVKESNGTAALNPEMKSTGDTAEPVEDSVSVTSSQTNDAPSTNDKPETANFSEDVSANPPTQSEAAEDSTEQ
ncbi:uncharacterized protein LOC133980534 [Scomber scombrus]|uniref:uncharacterized protein LOC133980534 n=1 Tax=Scomber scombrus TaxID=13677 RepID=UPI002DD7B9B6|nr:uncharacterized protein LOC133980534 [Scomber scombrus]